MGFPVWALTPHSALHLFPASSLFSGLLGWILPKEHSDKNEVSSLAQAVQLSERGARQGAREPRRVRWGLSPARDPRTLAKPTSELSPPGIRELGNYPPTTTPLVEGVPQGNTLALPGVPAKAEPTAVPGVLQAEIKAQVGSCLSQLLETLGQATREGQGRDSVPCHFSMPWEEPHSLGLVFKAGLGLPDEIQVTQFNSEST